MVTLNLVEYTLLSDAAMAYEKLRDSYETATNIVITKRDYVRLTRRLELLDTLTVGELRDFMKLVQKRRNQKDVTGRRRDKREWQSAARSSMRKFFDLGRQEKNPRKF